MIKRAMQKQHNIVVYLTTIELELDPASRLGAADRLSANDWLILSEVQAICLGTALSPDNAYPRMVA